jgi:chaperonin GroES
MSETPAPTTADAASDARQREVAVLGDRVLIDLPGNGERTSKGGILIPATAQSVDRKGLWGRVRAVGPYVRSLQVDDEALYLPEDAIEVDVHGDTMLVVRERDVHAVASVHNEAATGLYL